MRNNTRIDKINSEIQRELAIMFRGEMKDPVIAKAMTTVTRVNTTTDLKVCKAYISVMGTEGKKKEVMKALKNASGWIRREIAKRINLRATPEFTFLIDDSLDYSMHMDELFKKIKED